MFGGKTVELGCLFSVRHQAALHPTLRPPEVVQALPQDVKQGRLRLVEAYVAPRNDHLPILDPCPSVEHARSLLDSLGIEYTEGHVVAAVSADRWGQKVAGELLSQSFHKPACIARRAGAVPQARCIANGYQRSEQPPRGRRPFDQAFVDVVTEGRGVIAAGRKSKCQGNGHGVLLTVPCVIIVVRSNGLILFLALLEFVFERHGGHFHLALAFVDDSSQFGLQFLK